MIIAVIRRTRPFHKPCLSPRRRFRTECQIRERRRSRGRRRRCRRRLRADGGGTTTRRRECQVCRETLLAHLVKVFLDRGADAEVRRGAFAEGGGGVAEVADELGVRQSIN